MHFIIHMLPDRWTNFENSGVKYLNKTFFHFHKNKCVFCTWKTTYIQLILAEVCWMGKKQYKNNIIFVYWSAGLVIRSGNFHFIFSYHFNNLILYRMGLAAFIVLHPALTQVLLKPWKIVCFIYCILIFFEMFVSHVSDNLAK